jgi:hypothetical protein
MDIKRVIDDVREARMDRGVGAVVGGLHNTLLTDRRIGGMSTKSSSGGSKSWRES